MKFFWRFVKIELTIAIVYKQVSNLNPNFVRDTHWRIAIIIIIIHKVYNLLEFN